MKRLLVALTLTIIVAVTFAFSVPFYQNEAPPAFGYGYGYAYPSVSLGPVVPMPEPIVKTNYITVTVTKEWERVVYPSLRDFRTWNELADWLATHLPGEYIPEVSDCDDQARALQKAAEKDGYYISLQVDLERKHMLNSVIIVNDIYFIEPQDHGIWFVLNVDDPSTISSGGKNVD